MSQLPRFPEDGDHGADRAPLRGRARAGIILAVLVVATLIVLHLTGVIDPAGH